MLSSWLLGSLLATQPSPPGDSLIRQAGMLVHTGFIIPHAPDLKALAQSRPVGLEFTFSRTPLSRKAFERCNCFARTGGYLHYIAFNNSAQLGRTVGIGGFFEPLIRPQRPLYVSLRTTAGLTYLTRIYNAGTNPDNTFFGSAVSGLMALSVALNYRLHSHWQVSAMAQYNHISNGGIRQPNRGMNFPTAGLSLTYTPNPLPFPSPDRWSRPRLTNRLTHRLTAFGAVRTLPQTAAYPEQAGWSWGLTATAGYRVTRFHAFTGGLELVNDTYLRLQLQRSGLAQPYGQLGLLGGYELWLGRYVFATHLGWNIRQPGVLLGSPFFQRYQLLYTLRNRYQLGVGLRAKLNVAEGFDIRLGVQF